MEKDQVRGNDSLVTFEEILQIAKDKDVSSLSQKMCIYRFLNISSQLSLIICQLSLFPVMIMLWNSDWEAFRAIPSQRHSLKYLRGCATGSLRLRTCSTKAHSSAMGVLIG